MWTYLFFAIITLALFVVESKPDLYDAKEFENCGKRPATQTRMKRLFDNSTFDDENVKKIIGGEAVAVGEMPWITRIVVRSKPLGKSRYCTGALISSQYVLTAAHCFEAFRNKSNPADCKEEPFDKLEVTVNVGATNLKAGSPKEKLGEELRAVKKFMDQKWYAGNCITNDIAIIKLDKKVSAYKYPPICLMDRDTAATDMGKLKEIKQHAWISGYGQNPKRNRELLQKVMIAPVTPCLCRGFPVACSSMSKGKGGGEGDSGSPLAVLLNGRYYAYAVLTEGSNCEKLTITSRNIYEWLEPRMGEVRGIISQ